MSEAPRKRACPCCAHARHTVFLELEAHQFCDINATYRQDYRYVLGLCDQAVFPVVRCDECGFYFSRDLPSQEFLTKVYDEVIVSDANAAVSDSPAASARRMRILSQMVALSPQLTPARLLDYAIRGLGVETTESAFYRLDGARE